MTYEEGLEIKKKYKLDFYDEISEEDAEKLFVLAAETLFNDFEQRKNKV